MSGAFVPPPGSEHDDRGPGLRAFVIVLIVIVVTSISFRFFSRSLRSCENNQDYRFWWDDWAALAAVPVVLTQLGLSLANISLGFGRHVWTLPSRNIDIMLKFNFAIYFIYDLGLFLAKISALLFLQRIFPNYANARWFNLVLNITYALNVTWLLGIVFGTLFMCTPIEKNWNLSIPGTCGSTTALFIGSAVPSVVIDLIILILPLPKIWGLQTGRARKFGILIIFVFGYGVVVVSLGRLIQVLTSGDALDTDLTFAGVPVVSWVTAEPPITVLSICVPALLPLGRYIARSYLSPLASKVSLLVSSRGMSSGGHLSGSDAEHDRSIRLRSNKSANIFTERERIPSMDSKREILRVSPNQDYYSASVHGGVSQGTWNNGLTSDHIRVDSDVSVSQNGQQ
ncbi:hypothetical protein F5X98DRAFT_229272 [Xylaria grammica]|nr:hypothetical protein F5X98DRAFT_229272 [Xylaria grammica]